MVNASHTQIMTITITINSIKGEQIFSQTGDFQAGRNYKIGGNSSA